LKEEGKGVDEKAEWMKEEEEDEEEEEERKTEK